MNQKFSVFTATFTQLQLRVLVFHQGVADEVIDSFVCFLCVWCVIRMKGEENSVMRDYVLPDFSSIKKGFCKVRKPFFYRGKRVSVPPSSLVFLSTSHEKRWS